MNFKYVIVGDKCRAKLVYSSLNYFEFKDMFYKTYVEKLHPDGKETIYRCGCIDFINPKVLCADDFLQTLPLLMHVD